MREVEWLLSMRKVSAIREARERRPSEERRRRLRVRDRDHRVAISPEESDGRQRGQRTPAVEHVAVLPAPVDDVAHATREGARRSSDRVHRREARDLFAIEGAPRGAERETGSAGHEGLAEAFDDERRCGEAKGHAYVTAEPPGGDKGESANPRPMLEKQHPQRDASSVGMAGQIDLVEAELLEPRADDAGVPVERVARVRPLG